nr:recombinase family protein [Nannocystis pusilla]
MSTTVNTTTEVASREDDPRAPIHRRILAMHKEGKSIRQISEILKDEEVPGPQGGWWHPTSVHRVIQRAAEAAAKKKK